MKLSDFGESRWNSGTVANTAAKGTVLYMSPELLLIYKGTGFGEFNPEKSDIFSTGLTFLRLTLFLLEN